MPIAIDMKYWFEDAIFKHRGKSPKVLRYLFLSAELGRTKSRFYHM